jgi:uncharacterized protein
MAINIPEDRFTQILKEFLSASRPVSHHEHLMGRSDMLKRIERAFGSDGRHIFIHGDRGVGKTSLARAAGLFHQPAELGLLTVQCEPSATGYSIMRDIALKILPTNQALAKKTIKEKLSFGIPGLSYEKANELADGSVPIITSMNEALVVVSKLASSYKSPPVIIIDEFDQISEIEARRTVANFFKAVSDQEVPLRFIICGIGDSLDAMIGEHMSTGRLLAPLKLEPISVTARGEIILAAAKEMGVKIDRETLIRSATISDGFPYYVHLIGEHLFWQMYDDEQDVLISTPHHFDAALKAASEMAEPNLKHTYERATLKYKTDYEEVLWSVADDSLLQRQVTEIYEKSYLRLMERPGKKPMSKKTFTNRIAALCDSQTGVLEAKGNGWYQFKESRLRGYVRLVAERADVQLDSEHHFGKSAKREIADNGW